jgi:hypothetical protein
MVEVSATVDGHEYRHIAALPPADYPARRRQGAVDLIVASSLKELNLKVSDGKAKRRRATR